jgi:hypothetical protein
MLSLLLILLANTGQMAKSNVTGIGNIFPALLPQGHKINEGEGQTTYYSLLKQSPELPLFPQRKSLGKWLWY